MTPTRTKLALSTLAAFVLQVLPLPALPSMLRPPFAVLLVIFWSLTAPRLGGIALGFLVGLGLDVFLGVVLGQHALATSLVAYIALRQHLLVRTKPILEQSLFVAALLLAWVAACWTIESFTGQSTGDWTRWLQVLVGTAVWPLLMLWAGPSAAGNR